MTGGAEIAVIDEAGSRLPPGVDGEAIVRGPSGMGGYENDPAANELAFVDGWLRTGDPGRLRHLQEDLREIRLTHFLAISRYLPRPYPGRLTLFSAAEQSIAAFNDRTIGWNGMAAGGIEIHVTPGNHNSILEEPQVREVAEILGSLLGRRGSVLDRAEAAIKGAAIIG